MRKSPNNMSAALKRNRRVMKQRNKLVSSMVMSREQASTPIKRKTPFAEEPEMTTSLKRSCMSPLRGSALTLTKATTTTTNTCC